MLKGKQENMSTKSSRVKISAEEWKQLKREGKFRGVERRKCGTYVATLWSGSNRTRLGTFHNPESAAFAYEEAKRKKDQLEQMKKKGEVSCLDSSNRPGDSEEQLQRQKEVSCLDSSNRPADSEEEQLQQQREAEVFEGSSSSTGVSESVAYYSGSGLLEEIIAPYFKLPIP